MNDRQLLEKAARDMIMDSFVDGGFSLDSVPDRELARVFDEVMSVDMAPRGQEKIAEAQIDPDTKAAMEKAAEDAILGRMAARAYAVTYLNGVEKIAQGMAGLMTKIRGRTPEEGLALQRAKREQEIELTPQEVEKIRESTQSQRAGESLRQLQIKELEQRQQMAEELRHLQLQDQFDRRRREEMMFRRLHPKPGGALKATIGGGLAGLAGGKILQGIAAGGAQGAERLLPIARRMGTVGALGGLGLSMMGGGPSRVVERLERERYVPSSMSGDVRMASAEKQGALSTELLGNIMSMGRGSGIRGVEGVLMRLFREGKISEQQMRQLTQTAPEAAGGMTPSQVFGEAIQGKTSVAGASKKAQVVPSTTSYMNPGRTGLEEDFRLRFGGLQDTFHPGAGGQPAWMYESSGGATPSWGEDFIRFLKERYPVDASGNPVYQK